MRECNNCGKLYDTSKKTLRSKYCSSKCRAKYNTVKKIKARLNNKGAMIDYIFKRYKASAKKRNLLFKLDKDYFIKNVNANCYYCGLNIALVSFDRIDSGLGYTLDNVVPCCQHCNTMKWNYTKDEFIEQCKRIVNNCKT